MEIKFWDKLNKQYEIMEWLAVDNDGGIYDMRSEDDLEDLSGVFEVHYYINGERVV